MFTPNFLAVSLASIIILCGVWDFYAVLAGQDVLTVSQILYEWYRSAPAFSFLLGLLVGHLMLPLRIKPPRF